MYIKLYTDTDYPKMYYKYHCVAGLLRRMQFITKLHEQLFKCHTKYPDIIKNEHRTREFKLAISRNIF